MRFDPVGELEQRGGTRAGGLVRPAGEGLVGRHHRAIDVGRAGLGHAGDRLFAGRAGDGLGLAGQGIDQLAVDEILVTLHGGTPADRARRYGWGSGIGKPAVSRGQRPRASLRAAAAGSAAGRWHGSAGTAFESTWWTRSYPKRRSMAHGMRRVATRHAPVRGASSFSQWGKLGRWTGRGFGVGRGLRRTRTLTPNPAPGGRGGQGESGASIGAEPRSIWPCNPSRKRRADDGESG